jgi:hypothetical protein
VYDHFHFANRVNYQLETPKAKVQETLVEWIPEE